MHIFYRYRQRFIVIFLQNVQVKQFFAGNVHSVLLLLQLIYRMPGFDFNKVFSLKLRQHINNLVALNQSSCHACQMSVACTIKGPQRGSRGGGQYGLKENLQ